MNKKNKRDALIKEILLIPAFLLFTDCTNLSRIPHSAASAAASFKAAYSNKGLRSQLGIEDKLIRKYRDEGLLAYTKVGDKYWYSQQDVTDFLENSRQAAFA